MGKARNLADLLDSNGDVKVSNLDNVPPFENITDTGTEGTKVATGTTAQRGSTAGQIRFNSELGLAEYYTGSTFKSIDAPPTVSSVGNSNITQTQIDSGYDLTISGSGFNSGATVKFIGADNTEYVSPTVTVNSETSITARVHSSVSNGNEPFSIKVTNLSGLSNTLAEAFNVDALPIWTTASGNIGTVLNGTAISSLSIAATDPEGESISITSSDFSLSGVSLASSGSFSGTPSGGTYASGGETISFTATASDGANTSNRSFNIIRKWADGSTQDQYATSASAIKTLTSTTTNGYYWIQTTGMASPVQVWCDMNIDGGGWMRFWWYGRYEQTGTQPSSSTWTSMTNSNTEDLLRRPDLSTTAYNADYCPGRVPAGLSWNGLLVKGNSGRNPVSGGALRYMYWNYTYNSGNNTGNHFWESLQDGTTGSWTDNNSFQPTGHNLTDTTCLTIGGAADSWRYGTYGSSSYKGFNFDDDQGWGMTIFAAGSDGQQHGVDFASNAASSSSDWVRQDQSLVMYFR